jgi:peptidoglycan hydrolase-like protein with peptidoglycan-binding domain
VRGKYNYTSLHSFLLPTIRRGSSGPAVQMLQRLLGIDADGVFGAGTERALKTQQAKAGISADGACGPETWRRISGAYKFM